MSATVTWAGPVPATDDFGAPIYDTFFDGKTSLGPWAIMSPAMFKVHGRGLGTGLGQCFQRQPDGRWIKTGG